MKCRHGTSEPELWDLTLPSEPQDGVQDTGSLREKRFLRPLEHLRGYGATQGLAHRPENTSGFREALSQFFCGLAEALERVCGLWYTRILVGVQRTRELPIGVGDVGLSKAT